MTALIEALEADLERWGPAVSGTALAAAAYDIALRLSAEDVRPAAAAQLHAQYHAYLSDLHKLAPEHASEDGIDDLTAKRAARRAAIAQ